MQLNSSRDVLSIATSTISTSTQSTSINIISENSNALVIGDHKNYVALHTLGDGKIDINFAEMNVAARNFSIITAVSPTAFKIGSPTKYVTLNTFETGSLKLESISTLDMSTTTSELRMASARSDAFKIATDTQDFITFDTRPNGRISFGAEILDLSAVENTTILTAITKSALRIGANYSFLQFDTDGGGRLNMQLDELRLGDDDDFRITRPVHTHGDGSLTTMTGQMGGGTSSAGGSVVYVGGSGSVSGSGRGGDVVLRGRRIRHRREW